jgi:threonine synthase
VPTLANAMDVGDPSNMERVFDLYPDPAELRRDARSFSVDDEAIRREIARAHARHGRVLCPHTATALHVRQRLAAPDWIVVATAHPAKFDAIVEPLVGRTVELPPQLAELLSRPRRVSRIEPQLAALGAGMGWA